MMGNRCSGLVSGWRGLRELNWLMQACDIDAGGTLSAPVCSLAPCLPK